MSSDGKQLETIHSDWHGAATGPPSQVQRVDRHVASFSGGKDSTAMVLRLIEEEWPLDEIVFFDTGWEFPQMYDHIDKVENYIGREITRLKPEKAFEWWLLRQPIRKGQGSKSGPVHRVGNGWPSYSRRWCTREKVRAIERHGKDTHQYIGISANEAYRTTTKSLSRSNVSFPLMKWDMSEADCLDYCRDQGFDWDGLYELFPRVSCYCCPLQRIG